MALAGNTGATLLLDRGHAFWFGEDQARYILAVENVPALLARAAAAHVPAEAVGTTGGDSLTLPGAMTISLATLRAAHERFFPAWMGT